MSKKEINKVEETAQIYSADLNLDKKPYEDHLVLDKLLDLGLSQIESNDLRSHEDVMKEIKERYNLNI